MIDALAKSREYGNHCQFVILRQALRLCAEILSENLAQRRKGAKAPSASSFPLRPADVPHDRVRRLDAEPDVRERQPLVVAVAPVVCGRKPPRLEPRRSRFPPAGTSWHPSSTTAVASAPASRSKRSRARSIARNRSVSVVDSVATLDAMISHFRSGSAATDSASQRNAFASSPGNSRQSMSAVVSPGMTFAALSLPLSPVTETVARSAAGTERVGEQPRPPDRVRERRAGVAQIISKKGQIPSRRSTRSTSRLLGSGESGSMPSGGPSRDEFRDGAVRFPK